MDSSMNRQSILVVSDDIRQRRTIEGCLREGGFDQVTVVSNGSRALTAIRRSAPALAIVDACLSGMSCDELAEQIGAIPVVIVTAEHGEGPHIRASMSETAGVIVWPCSPTEFTSMTTEVLGRSNPGAVSVDQPKRGRNVRREAAWA